MLTNPLPRKFTQISEQLLPPVQVPFVLGRELFIFNQQDVRKMEDCRLFGISKLMPNGDLKSINIEDPNEWLLLTSKQENLQQLLAVLSAQRNQCHTQPTTQPQHCPTAELALPSCPQPMEVCDNRTVASIEQQLQWNKCVNTSAPFPMTYSHGTSTTEISTKQLGVKDQQICCCCCHKCPQCGSLKQLCNRTTNTPAVQNGNSNKSNEIMGAREQLKKKKVNYSFDYI